MGASNWSGLAIPKRPKENSMRDERREKRAERIDYERGNKRLAKARDGHRCRWPQKHTCEGPIESSHVFEHKKMGGDPAMDRSETRGLMTFCRGIHRTFEASIDGKDLRVEPLTDKGADGPCRFLARVPYHDIATGNTGDEWIEIARERAVGVLERRP